MIHKPLVSFTWLPCLLLADHHALQDLLAQLGLALLDAAEDQIPRGAVPGARKRYSGGNGCYEGCNCP